MRIGLWSLNSGLSLLVWWHKPNNIILFLIWHEVYNIVAVVIVLRFGPKIGPLRHWFMSTDNPYLVHTTQTVCVSTSLMRLSGSIEMFSLLQTHYFYNKTIKGQNLTKQLKANGKFVSSAVEVWNWLGKHHIISQELLESITWINRAFRKWKENVDDCQIVGRNKNLLLD